MVANFLLQHRSRMPKKANRNPTLECNLGVLLLDFFRLYGRALKQEEVAISCRWFNTLPVTPHWARPRAGVDHLETCPFCTHPCASFVVALIQQFGLLEPPSSLEVRRVGYLKEPGVCVCVWEGGGENGLENACFSVTNLCR